MLSNDDRYMAACQDRIAQLHPRTQEINSVAYGDGRVTWVHIIHFGGQAFNHMRDWMAGADNKAGSKGNEAVQAVQQALRYNVPSAVIERSCQTPLHFCRSYGGNLN
jgi:hypothetical protein